MHEWRRYLVDTDTAITRFSSYLIGFALLWLLSIRYSSIVDLIFSIFLQLLFICNVDAFSTTRKENIGRFEQLLRLHYQGIILRVPSIKLNADFLSQTGNSAHILVARCGNVRKSDSFTICIVQLGEKLSRVERQLNPSMASDHEAIK